METTAYHAGAIGWNATAAYAALGATAVSCCALIALHLISPEFSLSWRMVSEYANGKHPWVLTLVFLAWAIGSFALVVALWPITASTLGKAGLFFLVLGGIGQTMGGVFDINHKLHGMAAMIGIPSLCIAAVIVTLALKRTSGITPPPMMFAHFPWISLALMAGAFALFFASLKAAGVDVSGQSAPLQELPPGVSGYVGWANRLIFATSYLWTTLASLAVIKAGTT